MKDIEIIATFYMYSLISGICTIQHVKDWLFKIIEERDVLDDRLGNVLMLHNPRKEDVIKEISEFILYTKSEKVLRMTLGYIYEQMTYKNNELLIKSCTKLLLWTGLYNKDEYYNIYCLEDSYYLAKELSIGSVNDVIDNFLKIGHKYAEEFYEFKVVYQWYMKTSFFIS